MKKRITIVLAGLAVLFVLHAGSAFAQQSPAPTASPPAATSVPAEVETTAEESESRPWIRLVWLVPLAAAVGAATVFGRRFLIEREWLDAA